MSIARSTALAVSLLVALPPLVSAQTLGTFRWQMRPHCNVLTVTVTQTGGVYRVEGTDDQCGGGRDHASVQGLAFPNPDGTIGFGLTIVTAPGGQPVHVDAEISLAGLSGTWRTASGSTGPFSFTPGAPTAGDPRPTPSAAIPPAISLYSGGSIVARVEGDSGIPASGPGTRMMWYAAKAAFRAGSVNLNQWDDTNIGYNSVALGYNTLAVGTNSLAFGEGALASGAASTALGGFTRATGLYSTAMGAST